MSKLLLNRDGLERAFLVADSAKTRTQVTRDFELKIMFQGADSCPNEGAGYS